jgi:hypothetical protein
VIRLPAYWLSLSEDVRNELIAGIIIFTYGIVGLLAWLLGNAYSDAQADRAIRTSARIAQFDQAQEIQTAFAEGIPQNLFYLSGIRHKVLWMDSMGSAKDATGPYYDGRTFKEVAVSLEDDQRLWLKECRHYMALCERVRGRFGGPIGVCADLTRFTFDKLNDIDLDPTNLSSITVQLRGRLVALPKQLEDHSSQRRSDGRPVVMVELSSRDLQDLVQRLDSFSAKLLARTQPPERAGEMAPVPSSGPSGAAVTEPAQTMSVSPGESEARRSISPQSGDKQSVLRMRPQSNALATSLNDARELVALTTSIVDVLYTATVRAISEDLRVPPELSK